MWGIAKATLVVARYFRRIAESLEAIRELYELDLSERGIYLRKPMGKEDETEVMYGVKSDSTSSRDWE